MVLESASISLYSIPQKTYHELIQAVYDGIFITDDKGYITFSNAALLKIFGYTEYKNILGNHLSSFIHPENRNEILAFFNYNIIPDIKSLKIESIPILSRNGKNSQVEMDAAFIFDDVGVIGARGIIRNINPSIMDDGKHETSKDRFRTPYSNNDTLNLNLMNDGSIPFEKHEFQVNVALQEIKAKLNQEMLSKQKKNVCLKLSIPDTDPTLSIITDPFWFDQIMGTLLRNAIKHRDTGTIEFGYKIEIGMYPLFFIQDTGIGIHVDKHKNIYHVSVPESGDTAVDSKDDHIKLANIKMLIEKMNGRMWTTSEPGKRTAFYFHLGKEQVRSHATIHSKKELNSEPDWSDKNILVVEYMTNNFLYIEALLKKTKASLIHVKDGIEATEIIAKNPNIHLVLMDIRLPKMDGCNSTQKIKKIRPDLPVIAVTAYSMEKDKELCRKAGFDRYVSKPLNAGDLLMAITDQFQKATWKNKLFKKHFTRYI